MKKYKLIKEYPGSPKLGITLEYESGYYLQKNIGNTAIRREQIENYPEFWEEVVEKKYPNDLKVGDYVWDECMKRPIKITTQDSVDIHKSVLLSRKRFATKKEINDFEKDYEILSIKYNNNYYNRFDGTNYYDINAKIICDNTLGVHKDALNRNATIHSVKRLSDGEVFTVGDVLQVEKKFKDIIKSFETYSNKIIIRGDSFTCDISIAKHIKKPLFTTDFEIISWLSNNKLESIDDEKVYFDCKFDIIQSVKRKSDNSIFKIGDRINKGVIINIIIKKDKIYLEV